MREIRFGTSGWRGIFAEEFTFDNSRLVTAAVASCLQESGEAPRGVLVGHDPRFMGEDFARDAARVLSDYGIDVLLCEGPVPTPAVASLILSRKLGGALNFTASHNPAQYQGIKFSPSWGGPALPETTSRVEELIRRFQTHGLPPLSPSRGTVSTFDPAPEYLRKLGTLVDLDLIARQGPALVFDALYGAGLGYLDRILSEAGCRVTTLHGIRDPLFGGGPPEPSGERLAELSGLVSGTGSLGLATDGDADRFGIVGSRGEFYTPNSILSLLADYLIRIKKVPGDLARSVATTGHLDVIAAALGRQCHETPVGFKYIGQMIAEGKLAMGGEESAGMSIRGHVPEKDGILACLLVAEMVSSRQKPLQDLAGELEQRYGPMFSVRVNLRLTDDLAVRLRTILDSPPLEVGGFSAHRLVKVDGTKWLFENGDWVLLRLSGTEPVARLYVESTDSRRLQDLENAFARWVGDGHA